jgi:hypothetical protein
VASVYQRQQENSHKRIEQESIAKQKEADIKRFFELKVAILEQAKEQIKKGQNREVLANIEQWMFIGDKDLTDIYSKARTAQLIELLKSIPVEMFDKNLYLYQELVALNPNIEKYKEKANFYAEKARQAKRKSQILAEHKKEIERGFSKWDGSHIELEKYLKSIMNDPDSYEHVETQYRDDGESVFVITKFRGNNAFGGKVINSVSARTTFDGRIIEILK